MPAQLTNHQQHLLFAWRQKLVAALMHECVLLPEGVSDVAWPEALQTALESHQSWQDAGDNAPLLSTLVDVVPTIDAKITRHVHAGQLCLRSALLSGGRGQRGARLLRCSEGQQSAAALRRVLAAKLGDGAYGSWLAAANTAAMLPALGTPLTDAQGLTTHLLNQKSYAPTHESAAQLLNALCAVLRDPENAILGH